MCQAKTAVEMLKQHKSLTKGEIIMVFEKVIEDQKVANQDIKEMKKDVSDLKIDVASLKTGVEDIKLLLEKRKSFWDKIPLLKDIPNLGWIFLIVVVCVIGSVAGANLEFLKDWFHFGG
jgi:hypothetical protein